MSRIARQSGAPDSVQDSAQPQNEAVVGAHPKIARRPAQWKRPIKEIDAPADSKKATSPANTAASTFTGKAWQDDPYFSICLVALLLVLNVILMTLDGSPEQAKPEPSVMIQQVTRESVLPTPRASENNTVRLFASPPDRSRTSRHTIYNSIDEERFSTDEDSPSEGFESGYESR